MIEIIRELNKILALIPLQQFDNKDKSSYDNRRIFLRNTLNTIIYHYQYHLLRTLSSIDSFCRGLSLVQVLTSYHVGKLVFQV